MAFHSSEHGHVDRMAWLGRIDLVVVVDTDLVVVVDMVNWDIRLDLVALHFSAEFQRHSALSIELFHLVCQVCPTKNMHKTLQLENIRSLRIQNTYIFCFETWC